MCNGGNFTKIIVLNKEGSFVCFACLTLQELEKSQIKHLVKILLVVVNYFKVNLVVFAI